MLLRCRHAHRVAARVAARLDARLRRLAVVELGRLVVVLKAVIYLGEGFLVAMVAALDHSRVEVVRHVRGRAGGQLDLARRWRLPTRVLVRQCCDGAEALVQRCVLVGLAHTVVVGSGMLSGLGLPRLDVPLDLEDVAFAEHLRAFYQLVADLGRPATVYQSVLVLTKLRLKRTDLQVHLALIPRLMHLLCKQLLNCDRARWIIIEAEDGRLLGWQGCGRDG